MAKSTVEKEYKDKIREDGTIKEKIAARLCSVCTSVKNAEGHRISIRRLASLAGMHQFSIWQFEHAKCGMDVASLVRLKNALACSWGDLLDGCESEIVRERAKFLSISTSVVKRGTDAQRSGEIAEIVGANLRRLREHSKTAEGRKLSIEHLARLTALNHSSIWRFENGRNGMTVATLVRFKEAFGCAWGDLLDGCESKIFKERKRFVGKQINR